MSFHFMIVSHLLLILHKKYSFISLCLNPEMWQKVAKFKGAEYFRKALYNGLKDPIHNCIYHRLKDPIHNCIYHRLKDPIDNCSGHNFHSYKAIGSEGVKENMFTSLETILSLFPCPI